MLSSAGWAARGIPRRRVRLSDIVTVTAICDHGRRFVLGSTRVIAIVARTGQSPPSAPIERRLLTGKAVYHQGSERWSP
jgi:hypothetical protein